MTAATPSATGVLAERLFWLACLAVVASFAFPPESFWDVTLPGGSGRWAWLALALPWLATSPRTAPARSALLLPLRRLRAAVPEPLRAALAFVGVTALALLLRSELVYGDSLNVARFVENGEWFHKRAPLSIAAMQTIHRTVGAAFGLEATASVQLVSALAGGAAVLAVLHLATTIAGPRIALRPWIAASVLSSAASLLFLGYIEHYGLSSAVGLWAMALGARALEQDTTARTATFVATLAALVHGGMATLLVPVAYLIWRLEMRGGPSGEAARGLLRAVVPALGLAAAVITAMHLVGYALSHETGFGGGDRRMFVVWSDVGGYSRYHFLSAEHCQALLNQWLLVMPVVIPGWLIFGGSLAAPGAQRAEGSLRPATLVYLLLCGAAYWALTVVWNPDLGPLGDWDLFAPPGLFANAALAALVVVGLGDRATAATRVLALITAVNASRAIPWIAFNVAG